MMKKIYTILVCLCMLASFVACEKDKEFVLTTLSVTSEVLAPTYEAATIQCKLSADATISEAYVHYSLTSSFEDYEEVKMTLVNENYSALLLNLADNTTYYIRYEVSNKYSQVMSKSVNSFKTERLTTPTVLLGSLSEIQETQAKVVMSVVYDGGSSVTEMGVCWSTSSNPTKQNSHTRYDGFAIDAVLEITDLQPNTTYYVRAYAVNKVGVAYSEERSFTTLSDVQLPTLSTSTITQITETTAVAGGNVTSDGNASVTERGVVYSTNPNPVITNLYNTIKPCGSGTGSFTCELTNLQPNTTYYLRAYATNEKGTAYGEEVSFTTNKNIVLPSLITNIITQITETTAVAGGNVTSDGNASVTERGVVYSTNPNPVITNLYNTIKPCGSGTGSFTCDLTNLQPNTTYYVRAYATNSMGTAYGEEVSFTTEEKVVAIPEYVDLGLSVKWATFNVGATKPEEYGDYFAWGETEPKETYDYSTYKYCNGSKLTLTKYCTDIYYGTVDNKTTLEMSDDAARANWGGSWRMPTDGEITELKNNCTWTWTRQNGVNGYKVTSDKNGNSIFLPAAGYINGSSLGYAGSYSGYWSSSLRSDYQDDAYVLYFESDGVYQSYYYRRCGLSVRPVLGKSEEEVTDPTVTTAAITQITETSAVAGGNVTSDGNASVTERGVVYSTNPNPVITNLYNTIKPCGSGTGSFTCDLTNLQPNTTYYVRAYATNEMGTAYGEEVSFTTNGTENGYEYVDLGLSVKWATMNVGASSPEEYGDYFAWGETEPKEVYNWSTYKYCNGSDNSLTKYNNNSNYGTVDNKTQLELTDDVARANWGGSWRMPTDAELTELREQCTWTWTSQNGINGYKATSKSNGNSIFLPAAGYRNGSSLLDAGSTGYYWSSSFRTFIPCNAYELGFHSGKVYRSGNSRLYGLSVRPVCP